MQELHHSMWHYAGTFSAGNQSAWMVDSTCTLQLQACPLVHIQAANIHSPDSLGVRTLDCWESVLWMYFSMICESQSCTKRRSTTCHSTLNSQKKLQPKKDEKLLIPPIIWKPLFKEYFKNSVWTKWHLKQWGFVCLLISPVSIKCNQDQVASQDENSHVIHHKTQCVGTIKRTDLILNMEFIFALGLFLCKCDVITLPEKQTNKKQEAQISLVA